MKLKSIVSILLLGAVAAAAPAQDVVQIKGSDTMVNLVQRFAEVYMEKNPEAAIAVTGGGSGVGIAALASNRIAIANSSREMKEKETLSAKENGVVPRQVAIAIDGLCFITSDAVNLKSLTVSQLGAIFRGEVKSWKEVGGPDMPISLYGRQPSSGTYAFIQEMVMGNKNYTPKMKQMNGNAQIIEAVKAEKGGIGYVGVGYALENGKVAAGIKVLDVAKDAKSAPVSPLEPANVKSGKYPVARPLYQYINGKPRGAVKDFVQFELSPEGQKIVEEQGFYSIIGSNVKSGL